MMTSLIPPSSVLHMKGEKPTVWYHSVCKQQETQ